ncbi:MAG: LptF/LptG family permease [Bacteroidetes bacterium]|nr:LptF/LptG family permease [Bacteroidota bacterium]
MRLLHRMLLRALPLPFFGAAGMLMFLLLLQLLIRYARMLFGKGLPASIIVDFFVYNLAFILTLVVPMATFVAVIVAFAQMAESRAYTAAQAAGIALRQLVWPVLVAAALVGLGLAYFNNEMLPKARLQATLVRQNIENTQPGLALEPGVFFTGLTGYAILAQRLPTPSTMEDVFVVDQTKGTANRVYLRAVRGRMVPESRDAAVLILEDGSLIRDLLPAAAVSDSGLQMLPLGVVPAPQGSSQRTEALAFRRLRLRLDVSRLGFRRDTTGGYSGMRSRPTAEIVPELRTLERDRAVPRRRLDSLETALAAAAPPPDSAFTAEQRAAPDTLAPPVAPPRADAPLAGLDSAGQAVVRNAAQALLGRRRLETSVQRGNLDDAQRRGNLYRLELHKRQAFAVACLVLAMAGALLGLRVNSRRGGLARVGATAVAVVVFFWVTLVTGGKFSEQGLGPPWLGQWMANLLVGGVSLAMLLEWTPWRRRATDDERGA